MTVCQKTVRQMITSKVCMVNDSTANNSTSKVCMVNDSTANNSVSNDSVSNDGMPEDSKSNFHYVRTMKSNF